MWSITIENTKNKGISLRQKKWIKNNVIQHLVSLGRSSSPLHIFAWQYLPTILCKFTPNLSDCEDLVCTALFGATFTFFEKSGLWPGPSKTLIFFYWSHFLSSLLFWKDNFIFNLFIVFSFLSDVFLSQSWLVFGVVHNPLHLD